METKFIKNVAESIDSEEFDALLNAAELMERARRNLNNIDKTVYELKLLVNEGQDAVFCRGDLRSIIDSMETFVNEIYDDLGGEL